LSKSCFNLRTDRRTPAGELTKREREVLQLISRGRSNKEIALELSLSIATIKHHVQGMLGKLKVTRRAQAMRHVRESPWIAALADGSATAENRSKDL
jgi:DNA-binding NarL/FixJ family response regulator